MSDEKCCCNCLHNARWKTSKGVECHCDLDDKYLGYLTVMDIDRNCDKWEKETKWDIQVEHDKQIRADAIDECIDIVTDHNALILPLGYERIVNDMEQLKSQS